ncbi:MAG: response regulator transcription factor [Kutzneria sp.]|nr:response regulator transcription factor [Kutzneria sp.]MBV9843784.1 response regulator transcription factor [Kutzneria sp.]
MTADDTPFVRVLIADDRPAVRAALGTVLRLLPGVAVVGEAVRQWQVISQLQRHQPDVVLLGLALPDADPAGLTKRIRARHPTTGVIAVTAAPADEVVRAVLMAGAAGCLPPSAGRDAMVRALRAATASTSDRRSTARNRHDELTDRERAVLALVASGLTNAEIARRLSVSEATVKTHLNHAYTKAGLRNRAEAVRYARRNGLSPVDERD